MHQYRPPTSETVWLIEGSKHASYTFVGLTSMAKDWFRVVAITGDGQTIESPFVARVIPNRLFKVE